MDAAGTFERVASFDAGCRDRDTILAAAQDVVRLRRWLDARDTAVTGALSAVSSYPEKSLADATRTPVRRAERSKERADIAAAAPAFADALTQGLIDGEHLDAFGRGMRGLDAAQRRPCSTKRHDSLTSPRMSMPTRSLVA